MTASAGDNVACVTELRHGGVRRLPEGRSHGSVPTGDAVPKLENPHMKKLVILAALTLATLFGGMSAANAGVTVCANVNVNGQGTGGEQCQTVDLPALP